MKVFKPEPDVKLNEMNMGWRTGGAGQVRYSRWCGAGRACGVEQAGPENYTFLDREGVQVVSV